MGKQGSQLEDLSIKTRSAEAEACPEGDRLEEARPEGLDPERVRLAGRVHAALDALRRNVAIYPRSHPVLLKSLEALRRGLAKCLESLGEPFVLRTDVERDDDSGGPVAADLRRRLRRYLVRAVVVLPEAGDEELLAFARFLRDDPAGRAAAGPIADPSSWQAMEIEFYAPEDLSRLSFPEAASGVDDALLRAASTRGAVGFEAWLEGMPPALADTAARLLKQPEHVFEIGKIRFAMKRLAATAGAGADILTRVLAKAVPRPERVEEVEHAVKKAVRALGHFGQFVEENHESLRSTTAPASVDRLETLLEKFAEILRLRPEVLDEEEKLHSARDLLADLFSSAPGDPGARAARDPDSPLTEGQGAPSTRGQDGAPSLRGGLKSVTYDVREFAEAIRSADPREAYLSAALELLASDAHRQAVEASWQNVIRVTSGGDEDRGALENRLRTACRFLKGREDRPAEELVAALLGGVESPQDVALLLATEVLPATGGEGAKRVLEAFVRRRGDGAVHVLTALTRSGDPSLETAAKAFLTGRAGDPETLAVWALDDASCLLRPGVVTSVQRALPTRTLDAFRRAFAGAARDRVLAVLEGLPVGVEGMEQIALAAALSGPDDLRRHAITLLARYPSGACVQFLSGLVRKNNRGMFAPEEVEAAIVALKLMRSPEAMAFLRGVETERRWFRYAYRREIRDIVRRSTGGEEGA